MWKIFFLRFDFNLNKYPSMNSTKQSRGRMKSASSEAWKLPGFIHVYNWRLSKLRILSDTNCIYGYFNKQWYE